jgi:hypothetical protein
MLRSESTGFEDAVAQARPQVLKVFVPRQLEDEPVVARRILPCDTGAITLGTLAKPCVRYGQIRVTFPST